MAIKEVAINCMAGAVVGGIIANLANNPKLRAKFLELREKCMERCQERFGPHLTEEEERELAA